MEIIWDFRFDRFAEVFISIIEHIQALGFQIKIQLYIQNFNIIFIIYTLILYLFQLSLTALKV